MTRKGKRRRKASRMLRINEGAGCGLGEMKGSQTSLSSEERERPEKTDSLIKLSSNKEYKLWSFCMREYLTRKRLFRVIESPSSFLNDQEEIATKVLAILLRWTTSKFRDTVLASATPREAWRALEEKWMLIEAFIQRT